MTLLRLCVGTLTLCAAFNAASQKVYRCGPEGKTTYQQTPCEQGQVVDASDPRTAEQREAAQDVAKKDAKAAEKFDRDNLAAQPVPGKKSKSSSRAASAPKDGAASDAKAGKKKATEKDRPMVFLVPVPKTKPKPAPAAAKP
jgi:hypothetical protein